MSKKSKHNEVGSTGTESLRPGQQVPPVDPLKAERVQSTAEPCSERLKAERVQSRLRAMPGWQLASAGRAVNRRRQFPSARVAADFVNFVAQFSAQAGQAVALELAGKHLTIAVRAGSGSGLTESALDFAQALG